MEEVQDEVPRDVAKLWTWAREAAARLEGELARIVDALWGRDGTNGINGRTKALEVKVSQLEDDVQEAVTWGKRVWEVERPSACIGKAALDEYVKSKKREADEVRKARMALYGALGAALISAASAFAVAQTNKQTQVEVAMIAQQIRLQAAEAPTRYPAPAQAAPK